MNPRRRISIHQLRLSNDERIIRTAPIGIRADWRRRIRRSQRISFIRRQYDQKYIRAQMLLREARRFVKPQFAKSYISAALKLDHERTKLERYENNILKRNSGDWVVLPPRRT